METNTPLIVEMGLGDLRTFSEDSTNSWEKGSLGRLETGQAVVVPKRVIVEEVDRYLQTLSNETPAQRKEAKDQLLELVDVVERRGVVMALGSKLQEFYGFDNNWAEEIVKTFDENTHNQQRTIDIETMYDQNERFQKMKEAEPLALPYLYSQITGKSQFLFDEVAREMQRNPDSVSFRKNKGMVEISTSTKSIYGKDTVLGNFLTDRGGTTDTPISIFVPMLGQELESYSKEIATDSKRGKLHLMGDLIGLIKNRESLLGMQHGYGGDRGIFRGQVGKWVNGADYSKRYSEGDPRQIGIAMTTKGGEGTTLVNSQGEIVSGHMDLAAVQLATTLKALGLVGNDIESKTHFIGHSMAGQEMFWLAMYAQQAWGITFEMFSPVVTNDKEFLSLFGGEDKNLLSSGGMNGLFGEITQSIGKITNKEIKTMAEQFLGKVSTHEVKHESIGKRIVRALIDSGDISDPQELEEIIRVHVKNLKDPKYTQAVFQGLTQDKRLDEDMLTRMSRLYRDSVLAIFIAEEDKVLNPEIMRKKLEATGWSSLLKPIPGASHYGFLSRKYNEGLERRDRV